MQLQAGALASIKVVVRRSDGSIYTNPGLRATMQLNGMAFHGVVSGESITFSNVQVPNLPGAHTVSIELYVHDSQVLRTSHNLQVSVGPPGKSLSSLYCSSLICTWQPTSSCCHRSAHWTSRAP